MKKGIILFFIFHIVLSFAQTNTSDKKVKIVYGFKYQPNKTDTLKREEEMILLRNQEKSLFLSYRLYQKDSLFASEKEKGTQAMNILAKAQNSIKKSKFNYVIEKKFKTQEYIIEDKIFSDKYRYSEKMNELIWKPEEGSSKIEGLTCKKASTQFAGRNYIAWYTEEIPISDGPYKFYGLPGLIVRISDTQNQFIFTLKSVNEIESIDLPDGLSNRKTIETTKEKFVNAEKNFKENAINELKSRGIVFQEGSNVGKTIKQRNERENNPLELSL